MVEAGIALAIAALTTQTLGQLYNGSLQAWSVLQDALQFESESLELLGSLEIERFRLQLWGQNSGLSQGRLHPALAIVEHLIKERLVHINHILRDTNRLRSEYGLSEIELGSTLPPRPTGTSQALASPAAAATSGLLLRKHRLHRELQHQLQQAVLPRGTSLMTRARWAVGSKKQFKTLLSKLQDHLDTLNKLLTESQQLQFKCDWRRAEVEAIGLLNDVPSLRAVESAMHSSTNSKAGGMRSMANKKALTMAAEHERVEALRIEDFRTSLDLRKGKRFVTSSQDGYVAFERRTYYRDLDDDEYRILETRVKDLVLLLRSPSTNEFRTLECIGYCRDPYYPCWWLIYRYPLASPNAHSLHSPAMPATLLTYLADERCKPALEKRLQLASVICRTLSELYGSGWLHKDVRSENIVFLHLEGLPAEDDDEGGWDVSDPYTAGFEYSREYGDVPSIARGSSNLAETIYRHAAYRPGQAFLLEHDIYSVGLVLVEIAWWMPLREYLDMTTTTDDSPVTLSSDLAIMPSFGVDEAEELQRRVVAHVDHDLAFTMGSDYHAAVKWCLGIADRSPDDETEGWQMALDFYNRVALPLERLTSSSLSTLSSSSSSSSSSAAATT